MSIPIAKIINEVIKDVSISLVEGNLPYITNSLNCAIIA